MTDYAELVKALRLCMAYEYSCPECPYYGGHPDEDGCADILHKDAADAIEELQKDLERSKDFEAFWQHEAEEALKKFQVAIGSKPKWIPVTERLPEEDGKYLTVYKLNTIPPIPWIEVCWFAKNLRKVDKYEFPKKKPGFYKNDSEYGYFEVSGITHWMPLSEPPKEEQT